MTATRRDVRECIDNWFSTLARICAIESPFCFLCLAAVIDYLSTAANPRASRRVRYSQFIKDYFPAHYKRFTYRSGKVDLPDQMYDVLRNGLVHSFSLIPNSQARLKGGRDRAIVLIHQSAARGRRHLDPFSVTLAPDAVLFIAEDFLEDSLKAANKLWRMAKRGSTLEQDLLVHFTNQPPIQWHS